MTALHLRYELQKSSLEPRPFTFPPLSLKSVYRGSLEGIFSSDYKKKYRKEIDRFA